MGKFWLFITQLHSVAGPLLTLLYPLYASVIAIESTSKLDDEQWLAYWIIYSFLTLTEMVLQPLLEWIPIWYSVKLLLVAWLVLPQTKGAAFLYERFVRPHIRKYMPGTVQQSKSPNKFMNFVTPNKGDHAP
ncbi:hypothetical protein Lal_00006364 [Lupinus albus]|uniref:HVA22-like protein n=1 Tax=Lupinus albus TaxID=3870 RepID=A0A6A4Q992_LUPAL|nr:hypothetical protein Lalb_Chr07g0183551 [Lupinus albus]KAF1875734.1 hypothetical protein Lal_00006364 [Lupinus albus]